MMRTAVTFQRKTRTANGSGGFTDTWATLAGAPTRAHVKALSGYERLQSERLNAETKERLYCRYFAGLTPADRVQIDGRLYQIRFINNLERRNRWLEIDLEGGVAAG